LTTCMAVVTHFLPVCVSVDEGRNVAIGGTVGKGKVVVKDKNKFGQISP
jgi:hypothetical protein